MWTSAPSAEKTLSLHEPQKSFLTTGGPQAPPPPVRAPPAAMGPPPVIVGPRGPAKELPVFAPSFGEWGRPCPPPAPSAGHSPDAWITDPR